MVFVEVDKLFPCYFEEFACMGEVGAEGIVYHGEVVVATLMGCHDDSLQVSRVHAVDEVGADALRLPPPVNVAFGFEVVEALFVFCDAHFKGTNGDFGVVLLNGQAVRRRPCDDIPLLCDGLGDFLQPLHAFDGFDNGV